MQLSIDEEIVIETGRHDLEETFSKVEADLSAENRLITRIRVNNRPFWSVSDAIENVDEEVEWVHIESAGLAEYIEEVCKTASRYTVALSRGMDGCVDNWEAGTPTVAGGTWHDVLAGIGWLMETGSMIEGLLGSPQWYNLTERLTRVLRQLEFAMRQAEWVEAAQLVRFDLKSTVSAIADWFEDIELAKRLEGKTNTKGISIPSLES